MILSGALKVGDVVLYKRRKKIKEWVVNRISPSGDYFAIENDDWSERWVFRNSILEVIESNEDETFISDVARERPPVIDSKFA